MKGPNKQYQQQQQPEQQQLNYQEQNLMYLTFQQQQQFDLQQQNFQQLQAQELLQLQQQQQQEGINLYKNDNNGEDDQNDEIQGQEEFSDDSENEVNQRAQQEQQQQNQQIPLERGTSDERMRLSKMSAEQAEMEYQNRCQQQLQLLIAKSNSLKKTQSNSNGSSSNRQTANKNNNENQSQGVVIDKKQESIQKNAAEKIQSQQQGFVVSAQNGPKQQQNNLKQYPSQNVGNSVMNNPGQKHLIIAENKENHRIKSTKSQQNQHAIVNKSSNNHHPQRPSSSCDRLSQMYEYQIHMRRQKEEVAANIRQLQEQRSVAMCTFTPKLTKKASALSLRNNNYLPIEDKTTIFMIRKQVLAEKNQEEKRRQELISCPFSPSLNPRKVSSSVDRPEEQLSVYDRQIEWQKKVQEKNHQRMVSREASVMTPSARLGSAKKQQKGSVNEGNNNNNCSSLSCAPHQSQQGDQNLNYRGGFFQKERVSNTFLTYLTCKYQQFQAQDTGSHQSESQPVLLPSSAQRTRKNQIDTDYHSSDNNNNVPCDEHPQTLAVKPMLSENGINQKHQKDSYQEKKYIQSQQQQYSYLLKQLQQQSSIKPTSAISKYSILKKQESSRMLKHHDDINKSNMNQSSQSCSQIGQVNRLPCKAPSFSGVCRSNNIIVEKNRYVLADREEKECELFDQAKRNLAEYITAKIQQREGNSHGIQSNKGIGNKRE